MLRQTLLHLMISDVRHLVNCGPQHVQIPVWLDLLQLQFSAIVPLVGMSSVACQKTLFLVGNNVPVHVPLQNSASCE